MKKAIVIGATGMVGTQLIQLLIENEDYSDIISLVRHTSGIKSPKLTEQLIDFDKPETWSKAVKGNVLFSTLGTTLAQAKTKESQYKVDFTYQYTVAKIAAENGVQHYVLVSAAGANSKSKAFYMKIKGELETAVQALPFKVISILRPGQLNGFRDQKRSGEIVGLAIMKILNSIGLFKRYRPILASKVAKAMIIAAEEKHSSTYTLDEIFNLAE
jgi:uncharacterized protein YbjT (DUF2867 family)